MHEKPQVLKMYKDFSILNCLLFYNFLVKFSAGDVRLYPFLGSWKIQRLP